MKVKLLLSIAVAVSAALLYHNGTFNSSPQKAQTFEKAETPKEEVLDEAGQIRKISGRHIGTLGDLDFRRVVKTLASNQIRGCGEFYGVDASLKQSEYLVFCTRDSPGEMRGNFSHPGWVVYTVYPSENRVVSGNMTMHCGAVKSNAYECP